jgi:hypothetical protein
MPGVAHTCGSDQHKEIHFSLDYIKPLSPAFAPTEIEGVIVHEVVHCFQYNARNTCPGGLIEGIAGMSRPARCYGALDRSIRFYPFTRQIRTTTLERGQKWQMGCWV